MNWMDLILILSTSNKRLFDFYLTSNKCLFDFYLTSK